MIDPRLPWIPADELPPPVETACFVWRFDENGVGIAGLDRVVEVRIERVRSYMWAGHPTGLGTHLLPLDHWQYWIPARGPDV